MKLLEVLLEVLLEESLEKVLLLNIMLVEKIHSIVKTFDKKLCSIKFVFDESCIPSIEKRMIEKMVIENNTNRKTVFKNTSI